MSHGKTYCTCGTLVSQCKCPNHKKIVTEVNACLTCKAQEELLQDTFFTTTGWPYARQMWDALRPIVERMEQDGADQTSILNFITRVGRHLVFRDPMRGFRGS